MERSYLNLVTSQIDPVHYIKIDNYYYTLSFEDSCKVAFINKHKQALIELAYDLNVENYVGPFDVKRKQVDKQQFEIMKQDKKYIIVDASIIKDKQQIADFQKLSEDINFYYFPEEYIGEIVLIKYKKKESKS